MSILILALLVAAIVLFLLGVFNAPVKWGQVGWVALGLAVYMVVVLLQAAGKVS